jgi:hypothetical protein
MAYAPTLGPDAKPSMRIPALVAAIRVSRNRSAGSPN